MRVPESHDRRPLAKYDSNMQCIIHGTIAVIKTEGPCNDTTVESTIRVRRTKLHIHIQVVFPPMQRLPRLLLHL